MRNRNRDSKPVYPIAYMDLEIGYEKQVTDSKRSTCRKIWFKT